MMATHPALRGRVPRFLRLRASALRLFFFYGHHGGTTHKEVVLMRKNYKLESIAAIIVSTSNLPNWSAMLRRSKVVVSEWRAMKSL